MEDIRPMEQILEFWAKSMNCPICTMEGLGVTKEPGVPDLLCCPRCGTEFHFELGGSRIRLVQVPDAFHEHLYCKWMTYGKVRQIVSEINKTLIRPLPFTLQNRRGAPIPVTGGKQPSNLVDELRPDEIPQRAFEQARHLYGLGNSVQSIRDVLESDPRLSPAQVDSVIQEILAPVKQTQLERFLMGVLILIVVVIAGFLLVTSGVFATMIGSISGIVSEVGARVLPGEPNITYYNPTGYQYFCPQTQNGAAQLFGGRSDRWTFDQKNWNYMDVTAVNLFVPEGLSAGFTGSRVGFAITTVEGPAMVENVLALSIDCYR